MGAAIVELGRVVAFETVDRPAIEINADAARRLRLALHDRATSQVRFHGYVMRGHRRNDRLREPRRPFRPVPFRHRLLQCGSLLRPIDRMSTL